MNLYAASMKYQEAVFDLLYMIILKGKNHGASFNITKIASYSKFYWVKLWAFY